MEKENMTQEEYDAYIKERVDVALNDTRPRVSRDDANKLIADILNSKK